MVRIIDEDVTPMLTCNTGDIVAEQNMVNPRTSLMEKQYKIKLRGGVIKPSVSFDIAAIWLFSDQFQEDE